MTTTTANSSTFGRSYRHRSLPPPSFDAGVGRAHSSAHPHEPFARATPSGRPTGETAACRVAGSPAAAAGPSLASSVAYSVTHV